MLAMSSSVRRIKCQVFKPLNLHKINQDATSGMYNSFHPSHFLDYLKLLHITQEAILYLLHSLSRIPFFLMAKVSPSNYLFLGFFYSSMSFSWKNSKIDSSKTSQQFITNKWPSYLITAIVRIDKLHGYMTYYMTLSLSKKHIFFF